MRSIACFHTHNDLLCYDQVEAHFIRWFLTLTTGVRHIVEKGYDEEMVPEYWVTQLK